MDFVHQLSSLRFHTIQISPVLPQSESLILHERTKASPQRFRKGASSFKMPSRGISKVSHVSSSRRTLIQTIIHVVLIHAEFVKSHPPSGRILNLAHASRLHAMQEDPLTPDPLQQRLQRVNPLPHQEAGGIHNGGLQDFFGRKHAPRDGGHRAEIGEHLRAPHSRPGTKHSQCRWSQPPHR